MMSGIFRVGAHREETDIYDPQDRQVLVRFPTLLVAILTVTGVIAFALVGYLGYRSDPAIVQSLFRKAWPIFLWFSALVFTLEIAVLRSHKLRRYLVQALVVTLLAMVFVAIVAFFPNAVKDFLESINLRDLAIYISNIQNYPLTYLILNFGVIAVFWVDTFRRWLLVRGSPTNVNARVIDLGVGRIEIGEEGDLPTLPELIAGDLIAGGVLVAVLALIFQANVLNPIYGVLQTGTHITDCVVSLTLTCPTTAAPVTITRVDIIQALIYLPIGLITLALTATTKAFNVASEGEKAPETSAGAAGTAVAAPWTDTGQALSADMRPANPDGTGQRAGGRVRTSVVETIYEALRAPLQRRIRLVLDNLLIALRNVVWPAFILLAMLALGQASSNLAQYLRMQSDHANCTRGEIAVVASISDPKACIETASQIASGLQYGYLAAGAGLVAGAAIAIVIALMMLVFSLRVASNVFRFLGVVVWIAALVLWLFSLSLSVSNELFNLIHLTPRQPFPLLGASTSLSLLIFLIACLFLVFGRARSAKRLASQLRQGGQTA